MANFIKNLFTPKWQHSDEQVRLDSINQQLGQNVLSQIINTDESTQVRLKAISLMTESNELKNLLSHKSSEIKAAAFEQFCVITLNSTGKQAQISAITNITDNYLLMQLASQSFNSDISQAALKQLASEEELFNFIMQSESAKSRLLALEKIQNEDKLKSIEKAFKNKDKSLVRLAKNKLQSIDNEQKIAAAAQGKIESLLQQMTQLSEHAFNPEYLAKFTYLNQQWSNVSSDIQQQQIFNIAQSVCQATIEKNQNAIEEQAKENIAKQQAQDQRKNTADELDALFKLCKGGVHNQPDFASELETQLKSIEEKWMIASELSPADKTSTADFKAQIKPLTALLNSLTEISKLKAGSPHKTGVSELKKQQKQLKNSLKSINWPTEFSEHQAINKLNESLTSIDRELENLHNMQNSISKDVSSLLDELTENIKAGHLKPAKGLQQKIRKNLDRLEHEQSKVFAAQFQNLSADLTELDDWQGFAAAPKFENLCSEMESLINADLENKSRADAINNLQQQWKKLGSLPDKKQHNELWARFKKAADEAYKPCQEYYDDLSKVRAFNKEQRELICSQLELFFEQYDWANSDWKVIQQLLDKAHHEYKHFAPVDKQVNKALLARFNQAIKPIQGKLSEFYQVNIDEKAALISACRELLETDDLASSTELCKQHQQQWKTIGNAGRKEHALWAEFRKVCDAVFERRSQAYNAQKQENNQRHNDADSIIAAAKALLEMPAQQALSELTDYEEKIIALELPAKSQQLKLNKLNDLKKAIESNKAQAKQAQADLLWVNALELAKQLAQLELKQEQNSEAYQALIQQAQLPVALAPAFNARTNSDTQNNAFHELCLELEISMGLASPSEDQSARMAKQVQLLQLNMGKQAPARKQAIQELITRWCGLSANSHDFNDMQSRFYNGIETASNAG